MKDRIEYWKAVAENAEGEHDHVSEQRLRGMLAAAVERLEGFQVEAFEEHEEDIEKMLFGLLAEIVRIGDSPQGSVLMERWLREQVRVDPLPVFAVLYQTAMSRDWGDEEE